jgi:hypothetical protein
MKTKLFLIPIMISAALLGGCSQDKTSVADKIKTEVTDDIETDMNKAIEKAKSDLTDINIAMSDGGKATIAANGDLTIDGKSIPLSESQRVLTKKYFAASKQIALDGLEIGKESAKLATQAIGSAIGAIVSGENEADIEKKIEAKAGNIEAVAGKLCANALALNAIQAELTAALPEFTPEPMQVVTTADGCSVSSPDAGGDKALTAEEAAKADTSAQ